MIQDFDGLVGRFPRRREYIWMQPVCALAVPDTSVGERAVGGGRTAQIFMSGTIHMLCSGGDS